jgi:hypothetical protein
MAAGHCWAEAVRAAQVKSPEAPTLQRWQEAQSSTFQLICLEIPREKGLGTALGQPLDSAGIGEQAGYFISMGSLG